MLVSAIQQHGSAIGVQESPPSWTSLPPHATPLGCHRAPVWVPWVTQQIPAGCLFYIWQCICFLCSLPVPPTLSFLPLPAMWSLFSVAASPWLSCKSVHQYHLSRFRAAAPKSHQSCPTLWDPIDSSPPGSPVPGILQARTLVWVAISFSNAWKWRVTGKLLSPVRLFMTPWTAAYQAPPSMGLSRQEYWSGVPSPSPF